MPKYKTLWIICLLDDSGKIVDRSVVFDISIVVRLSVEILLLKL